MAADVNVVDADWPNLVLFERDVFEWEGFFMMTDIGGLTTICRYN